MKSKLKVEVAKRREVKTYAEMWHTSHCLLEKGTESQKASFHQFMASLVFTAFTMEAYLNHIGPKVFNCWNDLERLAPREKLNVIAERLQVDVSYSRRPWQVMKQLFGFRNDIAHGKSAIVKTCDVMPSDKSDEQRGVLVRTDWEKYCTRENAQRAREDVEMIVRTLYEAGRFEHDYPFTSGLAIGSNKLIEE